MTREEAQKLLDNKKTYFDYITGRVMKIDLSGEELSVCGYDRDNGQGAAERAIASLRSTGKTDSELVRKVHGSNTRDAVREVKGRLNDKTTYDSGVMYLGLDGFAGVLNEKADKALKKLREFDQ